MNCSLCGGVTKVIDSRLRDGIVRRRRQCLECRERFTSEEAPALAGRDSITKADAIRAMTNGEMARQMAKLSQSCLCDIICPDGCEAKTPIACRQTIANWLKQEV